MLKPGPGQAYDKHNAKNKPHNENIGKGVYLTPHIQDAFYYIDHSDEYGLIFQCRVNPKAIKVICDSDYNWVVNDTKDIRPYGIILIDIKKIK
jgi:hypothetical protein